MRLCRFDDNRLGVVDGPIVRDVTAALDVLPRQGYPFPTHDVLVEHLDRVVDRARTLSAERANARDRRGHAAQSRRKSWQDRRGPGQLREAPRRGPEGSAAPRQQPRQLVHHPDGGAVPEIDQLARRSRPGRGDPSSRSAHRSRGRIGHRDRQARKPGLASGCDGARRWLLDRARHLDSRLRGSQLPQVAGYLLGPGTVARDRRRDSKSGRPRSADHGQRRGASAVEYAALHPGSRRVDRDGVRRCTRFTPGISSSRARPRE